MTTVNAIHRRMAMLSVVAFGTALLLSVPGCRQANGDDGASAAKESREPGRTLTLSTEQVRHGAIRWARAELATVSDSVETPGQLVPDEDRTSRLGAPARGRIIAIHVNVGDRVSVGQPLVTIQSQEAG
jgi:multidrug efflux pump subunit AcrA (membrane-fusion protein)